MELKIIFTSIVLMACLASCRREPVVKEYYLWHRNEVDNVPIKVYQGSSEVERMAVDRAIEYLLEKRIDVDSLYITAIIYPDTTDQYKYEREDYIGIELAHKKSIDYSQNLEKENQRLKEQHKGEKLIPIIAPITGNISGQDRFIMYYYKNDSIVDILSQ